MPEIWLPYGNVEVAVSIKAENLAERINPQLSTIDNQELAEKIKEIDFKEKIRLFLPRPNSYSVIIVNYIIEHFKNNRLSLNNIEILSNGDSFGIIKRYITDKQIRMVDVHGSPKTVGKIDGIDISFPKIIDTSENILMITDTGFDPLFGFSGGPISLLRFIGGKPMGEAFRRRKNDEPSPGKFAEPAKFADQVASLFNKMVSIEVIPSSGGVSKVFIDNVDSGHKPVTDELFLKSKFSIPSGIRSVIMAAGGFNYDYTLADSLKSVWNIISVLKKKAYLALVSECSGGLGSEALRLYVSGQLDVETYLKKKSYVEGFEDIVYLRKSLQQTNLILVSALPNYYVEMKMGFHPFRKVGDALTYILSSSGHRTKVHIVPEGSMTFITQK
jgi:hypothetical protein